MEVGCCRASAIYKTWLAIKEGERPWVGAVKSDSLVAQLHSPLPWLNSAVRGAHSYSQTIFPHQTQFCYLSKNPPACLAHVPAYSTAVAGKKPIWSLSEAGGGESRRCRGRRSAVLAAAPGRGSPCTRCSLRSGEGNSGAEPPAPSLGWTSQPAKWILILASGKDLEAVQ